VIDVRQQRGEQRGGYDVPPVAGSQLWRHFRLLGEDRASDRENEMSFRGHAVAIPAGKLLIYPVYGKIPSSGSSYPVTNCLFFPVLQRLVTVLRNKSSILTGENKKRAMGDA
jgi:hypothetical protein